MYLYRFREPLKRHGSVPEGESMKKNLLMKNKQESPTRKVIDVPKAIRLPTETSRVSGHLCSYDLLVRRNQGIPKTEAILLYFVALKN